MITDLERKRAMLSEPNLEIYVVRHVDPPERQYPYIHETAIGMVLYNNWFDGDWYDTFEEAESHIAETVRDKYKVECIRLSRKLVVGQ